MWKDERVSEECLNRSHLSEAARKQYDSMLAQPVRILQIGEGNFLRAFFDWMIHVSAQRGLFNGGIAVTQPRPSGRTNLLKLARQDGMYTVVTRGMERGEIVSRQDTVGVFSRIIDPYEDWSGFLALAEVPELEIVVSNTTEAGLVYTSCDYTPDTPIVTFPGKLTLLLYKRYLKFGGEPNKGLTMLPCELLERNGDELKRCVLLHSRDWGLPEEFIVWVERHNRFLNSLVDRIVTGYPAGEADSWFQEWGYRDDLVTTAEPYHLWAIEADDSFECVLPFRISGLNVHWVDDLTPFQIRKVRILNGAHTMMALTGILRGLEYVGEMMEHAEFGLFIREAVRDEIIPGIPLDPAEASEYADSVFERFCNPFIRHRLSDIAMNSISKFKTRLLPTLEAYVSKHSVLPERIVQALAGLIRLYDVQLIDGVYTGMRLDGEAFAVRDDSKALALFNERWSKKRESGMSAAEFASDILQLEPLWGTDLTRIRGLAKRVGDELERWEGEHQ